MWMVVMDEDSVTERPCRYYSYPTKSQGICLILKWTVKNFDVLEISSAHKFPRVRPTPQCDLEVSLVKGEKLDVYIENKYESDIRFDATTVISDKDGKQLHQESVMGHWLKTKDSILPQLTKRKRLSDYLIIKIKIDLYKINSEIWDMSAWEREKERKLVEDMRNLILAELPAAVVLKTKDADEVSANRAILRARSSVFRKMFDSPLKEQDNGIVSIEDVNGTTLKTLVHFLHSGKADDLCESHLESLEEQYYAADKYEVLDLRDICAQTMIPLLTKENAFRVLVMAHRHSDEILKKECLCFISSSDWIEAIMESEDWKLFKAAFPGLAFEVLETCVKLSNRTADKKEKVERSKNTVCNILAADWSFMLDDADDDSYSSDY